ncbi:phage head spike fiber domain-containing protein [Algibacter lectus]|uniref:Lipoprotein n=1 Tax=Algibacter lectus TaxID=221126 RepID=A0A090VDY1_9FLAO|nr:hypothetical protein [Algibacter lectus]GAL62288.1 hypothetical protein JCM19300_3039 [Algibacter lectus]
MQRIILILVALTTIVGCKNKTNDKDTNKVEVLNKIILSQYPLWSLSRLTLEEADKDLIYDDKKAFILSRISTTETAYVSVNNIAVTYGNNYRVNIIVKQATLGNLFGLRIIGEYPNRIDAVFDLKKGLLKEVVDVGDFADGYGKIEDLGNGWFKCSLTGEVNTDKMKIIFGPTTSLCKTITWEAPTIDKCNNYIIPTSLTLEEMLY